MTAVFKNYIAGEWVERTGVTRNVNQPNTNDIVGEYAKADNAQTLRTVAAAKSAFLVWSRTTPQERYITALV